MKPLLLLTAPLAITLAAQADDEPTFAIMGDTPYADEEFDLLRRQLAELPPDLPFVIHLGDIKRSAEPCSRERYAPVAKILRESPVPVFIIPGDNEWNDCPDPDAAWALWTEFFFRLEDHWDHKLTVTRDEQRPENFAIDYRGTLILGLNLVGGRVHEPEEWEERAGDNLRWIDESLKSSPDAETVVIAGHAMPQPTNLAFFRSMADRIRDDGRPTLYIHGDGHRWSHQPGYHAARNLLRVQVDQGGLAPPVLITPQPHVLQSPFSIDRRIGADGAGEPAPPAIPDGHSHNDYQHPRPLMDALDRRVGSVEADIFLVRDELVVAHHPLELTKYGSLEDRYLRPLWRRWKTHGGKIYDSGQPLQLLIDFKTEAGPTWKKLREQLVAYRPMLTRCIDGIVEPGAVTIVLSGKRPVVEVEGCAERWVFIDGRRSELAQGPPAAISPLISASWGSVFSGSELTDQDHETLADWVTRVHLAGRSLRFWGVPNDPALWETLSRAGVDWIHVDDLDALSAQRAAADWNRSEILRAARAARAGTFRSNGITAHRGDYANHPENTMAAFRAAVELGADWIECDLVRTADGEIVVCHDQTTGRFADRDLLIAEATLEEVQALDVAHAFRTRHGKTVAEIPPASIPTLREVLLWLRKQNEVRLSLQPKADIVDETIALIRKLDVAPWVGFNDGSLPRMRRVKALAPEIPVFYDVGEFSEEHLEAALRFGFEAMVMYHTTVQVEHIQRLHDVGVEAGAWTVVEQPEMERLIALGIDRLYTDHLGRSAEAFQVRRRPIPTPAHQ